jgi:hypothetical protein
MSTSKTSPTNKAKILEEALADTDTISTIEQLLDVDKVILSLDSEDVESIDSHFADLLSRLGLEDSGYSSYQDIIDSLAATVR